LIISHLNSYVDISILCKQLEDMMRQDAFARDASGKMLTYKVVVKDGRVLAVLYLKGGNVERAVFVEHRLPVVGSVVSFPGSAHSSSAASDATRLGVVKQIPLGMAVCVADEGVENSNPCSFPRTEEVTKIIFNSIFHFISFDSL
jgi:hypothetical protein